LKVAGLKFVLEEHFALPDTIDDSERYFTPENWLKMRHRLVDIHEARLAEMDRHGIDLMILSLNAPAIQAVCDPRRAIELAHRANDYLAEQVAKHPKRFQGLAALPMQDPDAAAAEFTRCVKQLGFCGALVNGFSQLGHEDSAVYYDLPQYWPFWATVEQLGVPFYLHPRDPLPSRCQHYEGHPWFVGPVWAFAVETSIHALRLMASGLFDRYPKLQIILGHLGEGLPYNIWRADHRLSKDSRGMPAQKKLADYLRNNFYLTTSGNFRTQTLIDAILEVGSDRILFSADYPFEEIGEACQWFDHCSISETDREKIGAANARTLFGLPHA
jgi:predicted TIM-barrel fold metal-dependent hydrolase